MTLTQGLTQWLKASQRLASSLDLLNLLSIWRWRFSLGSALSCSILASTIKAPPDMLIAHNYIGGQWLKPSGVLTIGDSMNPATGEKAAQFVAASVQEVDAAIASARRAFESTTWAQQPKLRADVLRLFADRLEHNKAQVVQTLVQLNGKLQREAEGEVMAGISELRYYAGLARNLFGRVIEMEPDVYSHIEREAIGVAAIIVPWNAPVTLLVRSLAPALAAGCTVVIKAAHQTALVHTQVMACLVADERIPAGVINSFIEQDIVATQDLSSHFVQDEIFGPMITLETFSSDDEAVLRANATRYGLAASVWTADHRAARQITRRVKFGNVWVNAHNRLFAEIETGGYRQSGFGRLHGVEGLNDFMETKHVFMPCND